MNYPDPQQINPKELADIETSFEWVMKCIEGSTTRWHFTTCTTIVHLFSDKYYNLGGDWTSRLWNALRVKALICGEEIPFGS